MPTKPIAFLIYCLRSVRWWVLLAVIIVTFATVCGRVKLYIIKLIVDSAGAIADGNQDVEVLWILLTVYGAVHLINGSLWRSSGFTGLQLITRTRARISQVLFDYLGQHSLNYFHNRFAGALANKISNVLNGFDHLAKHTCLLYTSPSPRDQRGSRMPSSA